MSDTLKIEDFQAYEFMWKHRGVWPTGEPVYGTRGPMHAMQDAISLTDAPFAFPKTMLNIAREALEPQLVLTGLMTQIPYTYGQTIVLPATGAVGVFDMVESQEYPEIKMARGGSTMTANVGKVGVAAAISEETVRYSQFDLMNMLVRQIGRGFGRHKEMKVARMLSSMGTRIFDNVTPTGSLKGVCTGRSLDGTQNGAMTMEDLFDGYAHVMMQGFVPNTILLHPLMWGLWARDPYLRAFALQNGGGVYFAGYTGNPANVASAWKAAAQAGLGQGIGQNLVQGPTSASTGGATSGAAATDISQSPLMSGAPTIPGYFPFPLQVIVSPMVPFDPNRKISDVYLFDSNELGVIFVDEPLGMEEFKDPKVDIYHMKWRERYGFGILNEAQGVAVFKNVHLVPNEVVLPAQATLDVATSALANANATASVL